MNAGSTAQTNGAAGEGPADVLVALHGVGKTYGNGTLALAGVDLAVRAGEFLTLLGPSGCGKSTVLRLISGLDAITAGRLAWQRPLQRGDIGFVFQEPTLMPWASVFENVRLPLRLQSDLPPAAQARRVEDALTRVGLEGFRKAIPRELSGGMRMRASIARALISNPSLLLMDEPFAALDEITRFRLNDDLIRLQRDLRMTVVFVTHSVFESVFLSDRIAVMRARPGRIVTELTIDRDQPRDATWRSSRTYLDICNEASQALAQASAAHERFAEAR